MDSHYDYIILGSGLSGLLVAYQIANDSFFDTKSILLIDKEIKNSNDRTWCFWEKPYGEWDPILSKKWDKAFVGNSEFQKTFLLKPYFYKILRSSDFYFFIKQQLKSNDNFHFIKDDIQKWEETDEKVIVFGEKENYFGKLLFNSVFDSTTLLQQPKYPYLKQHFIGWFIETETDFFDETEVKFMDFTIPQKGNTRFMYVLPLSKKVALFEYTLFSEELLEKEEYESAIRDYLLEKGIYNYKIIEKEQGNIPMTCYPFHQKNTKRALHIGTAGGWTKPSTGFTFYNSSKKSKKLIAFLKTGKNLSSFHTKNRYWFYDLILLEVLYKNNEKGADIFGLLFKNNSVEDIFIFLNEEGTILKDLKIISSLPKLLFLKASLRALLKLF